MKKIYTKPEILVSKFDVETVVTEGNTSAVNLTANIYTAENENAKDAVAVVDYTKIFSTTANN